MRVCERVLPSLARSPEETAWEDGTFKLSVDFTEDYPNKAPTVKFMTKMFHPNSALAPRGPRASRAPAAAARPRRPRARFPRSLRGRFDLPRHPAEPVVAYLRHLRDPHLDSVAAVRPQPELARELRGRPPVPGRHTHRNRTQSARMDTPLAVRARRA